MFTSQKKTGLPVKIFIYRTQVTLLIVLLRATPRGNSLVLHCASLLNTIFASFARAHERMHVQNVRDFGSWLVYDDLPDAIKCIVISLTSAPTERNKGTVDTEEQEAQRHTGTVGTEEQISLKLSSIAK